MTFVSPYSIASLELKRALPKLTYYRRNFKLFSLKICWSKPRFLIIPTLNPCRLHEQNTLLEVWSQGRPSKGGYDRHRRHVTFEAIPNCLFSEDEAVRTQRQSLEAEEEKKKNRKYQLGRLPTTLK